MKRKADIEHIVSKIKDLRERLEPKATQWHLSSSEDSPVDSPEDFHIDSLDTFEKYNKETESVLRQATQLHLSSSEDKAEDKPGDSLRKMMLDFTSSKRELEQIIGEDEIQRDPSLIELLDDVEKRLQTKSVEATMQGWDNKKEEEMADKQATMREWHKEHILHTTKHTIFAIYTRLRRLNRIKRGELKSILVAFNKSKQQLEQIMGKDEIQRHPRLPEIIKRLEEVETLLKTRSFAKKSVAVLISQAKTNVVQQAASDADTKSNAHATEVEVVQQDASAADRSKVRQTRARVRSSALGSVTRAATKGTSNVAAVLKTRAKKAIRILSKSPNKSAISAEDPDPQQRSEDEEETTQGVNDCPETGTTVTISTDPEGNPIPDPQQRSEVGEATTQGANEGLKTGTTLTISTELEGNLIPDPQQRSKGEEATTQAVNTEERQGVSTPVLRSLPGTGVITGEGQSGQERMSTSKGSSLSSKALMSRTESLRTGAINATRMLAQKTKSAGVGRLKKISVATRFRAGRSGWRGNQSR